MNDATLMGLFARAEAGDGEVHLPTLIAALKRGITTSHDYPPIPIRAMDWSAVFEDYDGAPDAGYQPHGTGPTEVQAIIDLLINWEGTL